MKDGGPAFPMYGVYDANRGEVNPVGAYFDAGGMTLRDYFAAKAMAAYLAIDYEGCCRDPDKLAMWAYDNADAMLKEREK